MATKRKEDNLNPGHSCVLCTHEKSEKLSFFRFPKDTTRRAEWLAICNLKEKYVKKTACLCERHFMPEDIAGNSNRRVLKKNVVPKLNLLLKKRKAIPEGLQEMHEVRKIVAETEPNLASFIDEKSISSALIDKILCKKYQKMDTIPDASSVSNFVEVNFESTPNTTCPSNFMETNSENYHQWEASMSLSEYVRQKEKEVEDLKESVQNLQKRITELENPSFSTSLETPSRTQDSGNDDLLFRYGGDIGTPHAATPRRALRGIRVLRSAYENEKSSAKVVKQKLRRAEKKMESLNEVIEELRNSQLISEELHTNMMAQLPPLFREISLRSIVGRCTRYAPQIRKFALTLHFYSPQAYKYVRSEWANLLPAESTLRKWCCTVKCEPGFSEEVLQCLKAKSENNGPLVCNLVVDEMKIRDQLLIKNGKLYGPINLGFEDEKSNEEIDEIQEAIEEHGEELNDNMPSSLPPIAKNCLVFMLVNLRGHWKVPCGYFFMNSLSGKERSNLLTTCLELVHENGVFVRSLTFDGCSSNFTMVEELGACFDMNDDKFKPEFPHPVTQEPIYIFPDPPHMLKNVRNNFAKTLKFEKIAPSEDHVQQATVASCSDQTAKKENIVSDKKSKKKRKSKSRTVRAVNKGKCGPSKDVEPVEEKEVLNEKSESIPKTAPKKTREEPMEDENGRPISWGYITKLIMKQKRAGGLRTGNKLKMKHLKFKDSIMNVRLAAQVLSHSTSASLKYLSNEDERFKDAHGTAEFCNNFNDAFDILNCRSKFAHKNEFGRPINEENYDKLKSRSLEIIKYIKTLKNYKKQLIVRSKQKCGYVGFIASLTNVFKLYDALKEHHGMNYLLSYKLSQDHLENFFSCIRLRGGFNNNPNAWQFRVAYRRLIIHHQISSSNVANCEPDETPILFVSSLKAEPEDLQPQEINFEKFNFENIDRLPTKFLADIIDYIGGCIIRKLKKKELIANCKLCMSAMEDPNRPSDLIDCKSKGFLKRPSEDLAVILRKVEEIIRANPNSIWDSDFVDTTIEYVASEMSTIFPHANDENGVHSNRLRKLVVGLYLKIRLNHEAEIVTEVDKYIRRIFTKLVQFRGQ